MGAARAHISPKSAHSAAIYRRHRMQEVQPIRCPLSLSSYQLSF